VLETKKMVIEGSQLKLIPSFMTNAKGIKSSMKYGRTTENERKRRKRQGKVKQPGFREVPRKKGNCVI